MTSLSAFSSVIGLNFNFLDLHPIDLKFTREVYSGALITNLERKFKFDENIEVSAMSYNLNTKCLEVL